MKANLWAALLTLVVLIPAPAGAQSAPSFVCSAAGSEIERTICATPDLARADSVMARLFVKARVSAWGSGPSMQLAAQRQWLAGRRTCAAPASLGEPGGIADCLRSSYRQRNYRLAVAVLPTDRLAGQVLRETDPKAAPLIEAVTDYALLPAGSDRSAVAKLLAPAFDRFQNDEASHWGREILKDSGVTTLAEALSSDAKFASTIQVLSAYAQTEITPIVLPCMALLRKPALADATGPMFGSTMDNFVARTDCEDAMPPLPRLAALTISIRNTWPECEGTIRFAAYSGYALSLTKLRLARPTRPAATGALPRLKGVPSALAGAALDEVAAYVQTYRGLPPAQARAQAQALLHAVLSNAHECGS